MALSPSSGDWVIVRGFIFSKRPPACSWVSGKEKGRNKCGLGKKRSIGWVLEPEYDADFNYAVVQIVDFFPNQLNRVKIDVAVSQSQ